MSGAELIALIGISASVIQVVETCMKVLSRIQELRHQDGALEDLAVQLPLLMKDIEALDSLEYRNSLDDATKAALVRVLEGCQRQLRTLDSLLQDMMTKMSSSKFKRAWQGFRSVGKDTKLRAVVGSLAEYKSTITLHLSSRHVKHYQIIAASEDVDTETYYDVPAQAVSNFVTRGQIQNRIRSAAGTSRTNPAVVVLTGPGGQGKSQLALEFCRQSAPEFKGIFWLDASSEASARRDYAKIVDKLDKNGVRSFVDNNARISYLKNTLRSWKHPWLLVFDNYDAPQAFSNIAEFFPQSNKDVQSIILVTSRNVLSESLGSSVQVDSLTEEEAVQLLFSRSTRYKNTNDDLKEAKLVAKQLGYLALAIDQVSAYMSIRGMPMSAFSEHYKERKAFILNHTPEALWKYRGTLDGSAEQNLSVLTTWELSFGQMSRDMDERDKIGDFLTCSAFFNPSAINESLFKGYVDPRIANHATNEQQTDQPSWTSLFIFEGKWDTFHFQDAVVRLRMLSLVQSMQITKDGVNFSLHPLIKEWLQIRKEVLAKEFTFTAIRMVASQVELDESRSLPLRDRLELLGHVDCSVENTQTYLDTDESIQQYGGIKEGFRTSFAMLYANNDRHFDAEKLLKENLGHQRVLLGPQHVETMRTANALGSVYIEMGRVAEAEDILTRNLQEKEKALGPDHVRTLDTVTNLGNLYSLKFELEKAREMYQRAFHGYMKIHGSQSDETVARSLNNLGEVALKTNDLAAAEHHFITVIDECKDQSAQAAFILHVRSNLALVYGMQGRYDLAKELYARVIANRSSMLGPTHSETVRSMFELASLHLRAGNIEHGKYWHMTAREAMTGRTASLKDLGNWESDLPDSLRRKPVQLISRPRSPSWKGSMVRRKRRSESKPNHEIREPLATRGSEPNPAHSLASNPAFSFPEPKRAPRGPPSPPWETFGPLGDPYSGLSPHGWHSNLSSCLPRDWKPPQAVTDQRDPLDFSGQY